MNQLRSASIFVALLLAVTIVQLASAEVTQMFGTRKSWQQYTGVQAISSTPDPDANQQGVWGVLTWAAGPVGLRVNAITSQADDPFIESGPQKIYNPTANTYSRYPYYSMDRGPGYNPVAANLTSQPLSPGSYNKYTVWNNGGSYSVRFCKWSTTTSGYTSCNTWRTGLNLGRQTFDNVVAGGESLCSFVSNGGCPVGYVRHTENYFLDVANNVWYAYCYTGDAGSPFIYNAPSGFLPNGQSFAAGVVSSCGPGANFYVLYR